MQESRIYHLLSKYLDQTISAEESRELRLLVNESDDDELSVHLSHLWKETRPMDALDEDLVADMFTGIEKRTRRNRVALLSRKLARIAAILLIPLLSLLSAYLYFSAHIQDEEAGELIVSADRGERAGVVLPDGTKVRLNAESRLSYMPDFGKERRKVNLEGEAYFEVTKNAEKPFVVHTGYLDIEVLGTCFNVYAYDEEDVIEMALVSGKIKIVTCSEPSRTVLLSPNEKALFHKSSGDISVVNTDNRFETAWLKGDLVFHSVPLREVIEKLSRKYGVNIHLDDPSLANDIFTGNFDGEHVTDAMELLKKHYRFTYEIRGKEVYIE